ncbi:MAG: 16S rRNA (adenine(1518)-N(6)/adenine(1519)-N(6))-dimethyltransferase RsmA [Lactobacillales bacterium]|nr:16S rRNA (adenine(1518)-N(6)/adenine(1519)-N(6))-dimethyltransferase RsmA [Lactobacillales bacterium]MDR1254061.1 16S rRNA (adenine(1518)-N(6)/adenine(1519)-N(6))-dimethyltransferase RsmA [Oscillospiraceae bacterium]
MNNLCNISNIKQILSVHGVNLSKKWGQNFIINPGICSKMADSCGANVKTCVLEIGPGIGTLTKELAIRAKKIVAVELDRRLISILEETLKDFENIKVICGDIQKIDVKRLILDEFKGMDTCVCANLPYYITSPIIMKFLEEKAPVKDLTFMVQKEAAQRICAVPGTREVGAISFAVRYYSEPKILFNVARGSFYPSPKVDSSVIKLKMRERPAVDVKDEKLFFKIIKAAFSQRRKMLVNAITKVLDISKEEAINFMDNLGINHTMRAENLSLSDLARLLKFL